MGIVELNQISVQISLSQSERVSLGLKDTLSLEVLPELLRYDDRYRLADSEQESDQRIDGCESRDGPDRGTCSSIFVLELEP